jgi:hypothetical protein
MCELQGQRHRAACHLTAALGSVRKADLKTGWQQIAIGANGELGSSHKMWKSADMPGTLMMTWSRQHGMWGGAHSTY